VILYPMTDIGGGIFSLVVTAIFLNFWRPKKEWHFSEDRGSKIEDRGSKQELSGHAAEAAALVDPRSSILDPRSSDKEPPLTTWSVSVAWAPYALMSVLLLLTGLVRQAEPRSRGGPVRIGPIQTNYMIPIPGLHKESHRDPRLHPVRAEQAALLAIGETNPLAVAAKVHVGQLVAPKPETAEFDFAWLTAPGTAVFLAALLSMVMLRMNAAQVGRVFRRTVYQMKIPIPTIACMLGLSYVTRYAGMDATLGVAFAETGWLYPFFAALLGWLGVFLTGTDAGSNALFGSLQKITATEVFNNHPEMFAGGLAQGQAQVLICTANSTGGVMGKMIDAQSICVATAATNQLGKEADIFKAVVWHSIVLAALVGLITLLQAYVYPFTLLVPRP
jgi:lactate permease